MVDTKGIHHIGLSVSKLKESAAFFTDILGWQLVREVPEYPALFVSDGSIMLTLWQTNEGATLFDRKQNVGLHHLAINVSSEAVLFNLYERISTASNTAIEFAPELLREGPIKHMMCYEPSGIRIELIYVPN